MSINTENAKSIRSAMDVRCGLTYRTATALTYVLSGDVKLQDSNLSTSLGQADWDMRHLADFKGAGFPLDGSCELYDGGATASLANGKVGIRSNIGGTITVKVTAATTIAALTVAVTSGTGTITANGTAYEARRITVIPVNARTITLTVASDNTADRIEIASIIPGVVLQFDNDNLISVDLDLRSDLSIINPTWQVSGIEIQAYWPDDIASAVANIGDDVPIWYYSGYPGDYSDTRNFYLSEQVTMENNILTIRGEDQSHKLEAAKDVALQRLDTTSKNGRKNLYLFFRNIITNAGIKPIYTEAAPTESGTTTTNRNMVMTEAARTEYVADIMNIGHTGTFWPVFVDAGIPRITWTKPTVKWDIYESDCGDVKREYTRNINKLTTDADNEHGVTNTVTKATAWTVIDEAVTIKAGVPIIKNFSEPEWYWQYDVAWKKNNSFDWATLDSVKWTPTKTTGTEEITMPVKPADPFSNSSKVKYQTVKVTVWKPALKGKRVTVTTNNKAITVSRPGVSETVSPLALGKCYQGTTMIYPNYNNLFNLSNVTGSFTWKGNPKMQPRDVFNFHRLDGTTEVCTIETIELKHEGGGTQAEISYRVGVI